MSEIYKQIKSDIVKSMKEKNGETVILRSLDSAIKQLFKVDMHRMNILKVMEYYQK